MLIIHTDISFLRNDNLIVEITKYSEKNQGSENEDINLRTKFWESKIKKASILVIICMVDLPLSKVSKTRGFVYVLLSL